MSDIQFRKEAKKTIISQEELTNLMRITTLKHWVMLYAIYGFLGVFILFACFGSIPTRVDGQGILLSTKGTIQDVIMPAGFGRVSAIKVAVGDNIKTGDIIAALDNQDVTNKIITAKKYLADLQAQQNQLKATAAKDLADRTTAYESQTTINKTTLAAEQTHLAQVEDLLKRKQEMAARGLVNKEQLMSSYNDYYAVKTKIDQLNASLIQDKLDLDKFRQDYETQLRNLSLNVSQAERDLADLEAQKNAVNDVKSTVSGVVTHLHVGLGDAVKEGQPILSVASLGTGLDAVLFVPAQQGQRVKVGSEVLVSPMNIKRAEYGSLAARATQVGAFPSSKESMLAILHNQNLVDEFTKSGAVIMLRAQIEPDANNASGYHWTTGQGPDQTITPGMLVTASMTVKTQAPITLLIPFFRHIFYGDEL